MISFWALVLFLIGGVQVQEYPDAPQGVRIKASRTLDWIVEGSAVSLTCEVQRSNPSVRSYSWYRYGTDLGETGQVLRFEAVRPEDRGSYRCLASNSVGSGDSPEFNITVRYGPRGTKIKASCCEGGVKAGQRLTLTCEADAHPAPYSYTWFRANTAPGGERIPGWTKVPPHLNGLSNLRYWRISTGDAGEYMCQATNSINTQNSSALRVDVLFGPTGLNLSMARTARESSLVTIHCTVESFPPSVLTLTWAPPSALRSDQSRQTKRLPGNYTVQSTRAALVASFTASVGDAGRYACRANNPEGRAETTQELVVNYDVRVMANPSGEVTEKTNLNLSCEARSNPNVTAYTWFKMTGGGAEEVGQGPVLTLRNLSEANTGQYFCRIRNKIGEGNSSIINITVKSSTAHSTTTFNTTASLQSKGGRFLWRHILSALVLLAAIGILIEYFISCRRTTDAAGRKRRGDENTEEFGETVC